jgi:hypothetical protein
MSRCKREKNATKMQRTCRMCTSNFFLCAERRMCRCKREKVLQICRKFQVRVEIRHKIDALCAELFN